MLVWKKSIAASAWHALAYMLGFQICIMSLLSSIHFSIIRLQRKIDWKLLSCREKSEGREDRGFSGDDDIIGSPPLMVVNKWLGSLGPICKWKNFSSLELH